MIIEGASLQNVQDLMSFLYCYPGDKKFEEKQYLKNLSLRYLPSTTREMVTHVATEKHVRHQMHRCLR